MLHEAVAIGRTLAEAAQDDKAALRAIDEFGRETGCLGVVSAERRLREALNLLVVGAWAGIGLATPRMLAAEGIRITSVASGFMLTRLWTDRANRMAAQRGVAPQEVIAEFARETPIGRFGEPDEVAAMVVWLT